MTKHGSTIDELKQFCYHGTIMSRNGKFNNAKQYLAEQASKALYGVLHNTRYYNISFKDR
jgi:hypothetical protein